MQRLQGSSFVKGKNYFNLKALYFIFKREKNHMFSSKGVIYVSVVLILSGRALQRITRVEVWWA
jgi:hypothetical protein